MIKGIRYTEVSRKIRSKRLFYRVKKF